MSERCVVGIDLGTTHCALAAAPEGDAHARPQVVPVPQLTGKNAVEERPLLPSFIYFAHESEGPCPLPWDEEREFAVGEYARIRSAESPGRVVSSSKSWLSHSGVDRRAGCLPQDAADDVEKISPVEAAWKYLDHLAEVWEHSPSGARVHGPLAEQDVTLAVPASFDAAARDLTLEAAYAAGFENVTLLEEPQAAVYAWLDSVGQRWRELLAPGDVILVVDIGGGTTDFSAISAVDHQGTLELKRVAVGEHILLGGDNMNLALAYRVKQKLEAQGHELDRFQMNALTHATRAAKETLLGAETPNAAKTCSIVVPSRSSKLMGDSLRSELTREEVHATILDGFFPSVTSDAPPQLRRRGALTQVGLPYAADAGITRHLAAFLTKQAGALVGVESGVLGADPKES